MQLPLKQLPTICSLNERRVRISEGSKRLQKAYSFFDLEKDLCCKTSPTSHWKKKIEQDKKKPRPFFGWRLASKHVSGGSRTSSSRCIKKERLKAWPTKNALGPNLQKVDGSVRGNHGKLWGWLMADEGFGFSSLPKTCLTVGVDPKFWPSLQNFTRKIDLDSSEWHLCTGAWRSAFFSLVFRDELKVLVI